MFVFQEHEVLADFNIYLFSLAKLDLRIGKLKYTGNYFFRVQSPKSCNERLFSISINLPIILLIDCGHFTKHHHYHPDMT